MIPRQMAKVLGRRGGRQRAGRLSAEDRRRIASLGGEARGRSLLMAQRIEDNLRYAAAVLELRRPPITVTRLNAFEGRLPGIYRRAVSRETPRSIDRPWPSAGVGGGMALVMLGSRRVTRGFDFVIAQPGGALGNLIDVFYDRGLELASRVCVSILRPAPISSTHKRVCASISSSTFNRR